MHNRRFTRLTNAYSKKIENHIWGVALHVMFYNFVRLHSTLRTSPAMAAGITHRLWDMTDIIAIMDMRGTPPKRPATSRKRGAPAEFSNQDSTTLYCQKSAGRPKTPKKAPIPARALLRALRQS
jgi:hypothetical protein